MRNFEDGANGRVIFLDRDGVLNVDKYGAYRPEQLELIDGVVEGLGILQSLGFRLMIVTNQSAIGRGDVTADQVNHFHRLLLGVLAEQGIHIAEIFLCPHDAQFGVGDFKKDCACHKPKPGLFFQAADQYGLDLSECYFIGDKKSDVVAGFNAGCQTILVETGILDDEHKYPGVSPRYRVRSLVDAARIVAGELALEQLKSQKTFVPPFTAELCDRLG